MTDRGAPERELDWMREGTAVFTARLTGLSDDDLDAPTPLPGWTRRHVVAHMGYNARALLRLVHWARTGERTQMYESRAARDAEIEDGALQLSPAELRELALGTAEELGTALDGLSDDQWRAQVVTGQDQTVPAAEIPWMRCREVWVHAVDLDAGTEFADFPPEFVDALLTDLTTMRRRGEQEPALLLRPEDRQRTWTVEYAGRPAAEVTGPASAMAAWLMGRGDHGVRPTEQGTPVPELGRWI